MFDTFFQGTYFSAPSAVLDAGSGVYPVRKILKTPAASAVRKIEPTLYRLRTLWRIKYIFLSDRFFNWRQEVWVYSSREANLSRFVLPIFRSIVWIIRHRRNFCDARAIRPIKVGAEFKA